MNILHDFLIFGLSSSESYVQHIVNQYVSINGE